MIRVILPFHLRNLANTGAEVLLEIATPVTANTILDALETRYPMLRGTIRDHVTHQRRPLLRFFACEEDLSHEGMDALLPDELFRAKGAQLQAVVAASLPVAFEGVSLREGHLAGAGLALDSREGFLKRTIGLDRAPRTDIEWLALPEEDIVHVVNGTVWHDPSGGFTAVRVMNVLLSSLGDLPNCCR